MILIEENIQTTMMDTTNKEQQINVVDDATLQAILSSMTEPEMQVFIDELNRTGKACKSVSFFLKNKVFFFENMY